MDIIVRRSVNYTGLIIRRTSGLTSKFSLTPVQCICHCDATRRNGKVYNTNIQWRTAAASKYLAAENSILSRINVQDLFPKNGKQHFLAYSTSSPQPPNKDCYEPLPPEKQSVFQRMKQMTKDYWHILIPVHVVTSIGWISLFYIAAKNGVDIVRILEAMNLGDRYLDIMRGSSAGHWAVAYALYKLFTPIRYTVTVGGTTMSIRYLNRWGYLKFKPRATIKEMQSEKCATEHREKYAKAAFKEQQHTEPPKT